MARIRAIKPEYFTDSDIAELPPLVRLLFVGLWCHADRGGRLKDKPNTLKVLCLPYDEVDINQALDQLAAGGFIQRYDSSEGVATIQIRTWDQHQSPHHTEKESKLEPLLNGCLTVKAPLLNGARTTTVQDAPSPTPTLKKKKSSIRFVPPTLEQIQAHATDIDAQQFIDHYTSNGWKVGKNPMKCWKAAIRQWRRRQDDFRPKGEPAAGLPLEEHDERRNNRFDRTKKLLAQARGHDGKGLYE